MWPFETYDKKKYRITARFVYSKADKKLIEKIVSLQNEIEVSFSTKVIALTSIKADEVSASFAKALADAYEINKSKTLIIDANLYNPQIKSVLKPVIEENSSKKKTKKDSNVLSISDYIDVITFDKEAYPTKIYKDGNIQKLIKSNSSKYDHIIVLMPSIEAHKDISLLSDVIQSIVLITIKNITKKVDIYGAINYFNENKLPLAKTLLVK